MAFERGNKLGGRTHGAKNKVNTKIRESFELLIEENLEQLKTDLAALDAVERIRAIIQLTPFVIPKLRTVENINEFTEQPLFLTDEESKTLLSISEDKFNEFYDGK